MNLEKHSCVSAFSEKFGTDISLMKIDHYNREIVKNSFFFRPSGELSYQLILARSNTRIFESPLQVYTDVILLDDISRVLHHIVKRSLHDDCFRIVNVRFQPNVLSSCMQNHADNIVRFCWNYNEPVLAIQYALHCLRDYSFIENLQNFWDLSYILVHVSVGNVTKVGKVDKPSSLLNMSSSIVTPSEIYALLIDSVSMIPIYVERIHKFGFQNFVKRTIAKERSSPNSNIYENDFFEHFLIR